MKPEDNNFHGKNIAIIGAAKGFGHSIALDIARAGANLFLFDSDSLASGVAKSICLEGGNACFEALDVCHPEDFPAIFSKVLKDIKLDGLIYIPRARENKDFMSTTPHSWDNDINVALRGAFFSVQGLVPYLERNDGGCSSIVYMSSILSNFVGIESVGYHVAKAGLEQLTRYLSVKLGPRQIRVNAVQVAIAIKLESQKVFESVENSALRNIYLNSHPLKSVAKSNNVSDAILFLLSNKANFITGEILKLDGGISKQEHTDFYLRLKELAL